MAYGSVLTDVVQSSTAGTPPRFNDGNGTQVGTLCRAWGAYVFTSNGSAPTLRSSYNISSITRNSGGSFTFAFTNALSDANYSICVTPNVTGTGSSVMSYTYAQSTSSFTVFAGYPSNTSGTSTGYDAGVAFSVFR